MKKLIILILCLTLTGCYGWGLYGGLVGANLRNAMDNRETASRTEQLENELAELRSPPLKYPDYVISGGVVVCKNADRQEDEITESGLVRTCTWGKLKRYKGNEECSSRIRFTTIAGEPGVGISEEILPPQWFPAVNGATLPNVAQPPESGGNN